MYASTIRKINLGKKPPVLQSTLCIPKSPGWSLYISYGHDTSFLQKRGEIYLRNSVQARKKASQARLQGCVQGYKAVFQEGGDGIFWKGTFAQAKGNLQKQVSKHILYWGKLAFLCTQGRKDSLCYYIAFPARVIPKMAFSPPRLKHGKKRNH